MTTITIKDSEKLPKTNLENAEKLLDYLLQHFYFDKNLKKLNTEELADAAKAKKEWQQNSSEFSRVIK